MADLFAARRYARLIGERIGEAAAPGEELVEALAEILADHRHQVVCEVVRAVRASAHECEAAGRKRAARERWLLIGHLRKTFGVSAGKWPGTRKRGRSIITLKALFERDGGVCRLGRHPITLAEATRDHIIPLGQGGKHTTANLQLACRPCNEAKGNRTDAVLDPDDDSPAPTVVPQPAMAGC